MIVNEIAKQAGVPPHVVRYYTRIGLITPNRDPDNGYRLFGWSHVNRLKFVRQAQQLGLTLTEIQELIELKERGRQECCRRIRELLGQRVVDTEEKIARLQAQQSRIERALESWHGDGDCILDEHLGYRFLENTGTS